MGRVLAQQRCHRKRSGIARGEVLEKKAQRQTAVEDVLGHDDVAPFDMRIEILQDAHDA